MPILFIVAGIGALASGLAAAGATAIRAGALGATDAGAEIAGLAPSVGGVTGHTLAGLSGTGLAASIATATSGSEDGHVVGQGHTVKAVTERARGDV